MHTGNARQLALKVRYSAKVRIIIMEIAKCTSHEAEQLGITMLVTGANLDQLDEIGPRLHSEMILPDPGERIFHNDFG